MKRKSWILICVLMISYSSTGWEMPCDTPRGSASIIDVAFCLDTTGSMASLIEGAKSKIWSIVNIIEKARPKPTLRIAFVIYRDMGDEYVTKTFDFTSNLENMYSQLRSFLTDNGGDEPEHVNKALYDAIHNLQWTQSASALRLLFLVGDAPPHMDYKDGYDYRKIAMEASGSGIIINAIQCGNLNGTRAVWQEIANLAKGTYAAIPQTGGMTIPTTPYDDDLANLSDEINGTYLPYGKNGRENQRIQAFNDHDAGRRNPAAAADRASAKSGSLYNNDSWDLVDAYNNKNVELENFSDEELPAELRGLTTAQLVEYLQEKIHFREQIKNQIEDLSKKRKDFLDQEAKRLHNEDSFDQQVIQALQEQGRSKGICFQTSD